MLLVHGVHAAHNNRVSSSSRQEGGAPEIHREFSLSLSFSSFSFFLSQLLMPHNVALNGTLEGSARSKGSEGVCVHNAENQLDSNTNYRLPSRPLKRLHTTLWIHQSLFRALTDIERARC